MESERKEFWDFVDKMTEKQTQNAELQMLAAY